MDRLSSPSVAGVFQERRQMVKVHTVVALMKERVSDCTGCVYSVHRGEG